MNHEVGEDMRRLFLARILRGSPGNLQTMLKSVITFRCRMAVKGRDPDTKYTRDGGVCRKFDDVLQCPFELLINTRYFTGGEDKAS